MKYLLVTILMALSFNAFSQEVCLPYEVAKQITQDLLVGDSAKDLLAITNEELDLTKEKLSYKDSVISLYQLKEINLNEQVKNEQTQKANYITLYEDGKKQYAVLLKKYKLHKLKNTFTNIILTGAAGVLAYLFIVK
jgi:hypothetical protein